MMTSKKKHVSKKKKISWRKHIDLKDVEKFLEEQRQDDRIGKFSLKPDNELFQVDSKPSTELHLTTKQQRKLRFLLPPKCFSILQSHSNVPDPLIKRNRVRTKEERKNNILKRKEQKMRENGELKAKEKQSRKDKLLDQINRLKEPKRGDFKKDIWSSDNLRPLDSNEWLTQDTKRHTLQGIGQLKKKVPLNEKTSVFAAVEPPHPGTSYNPSFTDHQALLQDIVKTETNIIQVEKHLKRVTTQMFSKVSATKKAESWLTEMSEGLQAGQESENSDGEYKTINPAVKNKKKNLKQLRKRKEQRQLERERKLAKINKKKIADMYKLNAINKTIVETEAQQKFLHELREKQKLRKSKETKRLAANKFEEQDVPFNMAQDISGNLRNIKKEGNLLLDRFKSLQKRNILQPTVRRIHKLAKIKRFQKAGFKDDWKITVAKSLNKLVK